MPNSSSQSIAIGSPSTAFKTSTSRLQPAKSRHYPMILKLLRFGFRVVGNLSPRLAGRIAYKLWFTPTRFKTPASEKKAMDSADIKYVQLNGHNITTYAWGESGPTVLLVHGWSGRGTQLGSFVEPLMEMGYRVLSLDLPAHGKSSGKQTNLYEVVDTLLALQQSHGLFEAVITHSFGGPCIALATQKGFEAKRIVSVCPPSNTRGLVEKFATVLHIPEKASLDMARRIEDKFGKSIWEDVSMVNTVKELKIPGLLIHDDSDDDIPWQEGQAVAEAWDKAKFIKTSGLGHRRILRDASVIESVVHFIGEN